MFPGIIKKWVGGLHCLPCHPFAYFCFKSRTQLHSSNTPGSPSCQCFCVAAFFAPGPLIYAVHKRNVCHGGLGWASQCHHPCGLLL